MKNVTPLAKELTTSLVKLKVKYRIRRINREIGRNRGKTFSGGYKTSMHRETLEKKTGDRNAFENN